MMLDTWQGEWGKGQNQDQSSETPQSPKFKDNINKQNQPQTKLKMIQ